MDQIHQREREIVENIRRRNGRIELDGIEQPRCSINQRNIRQMKIAVAAPNETLPGTPLQQWLKRRDVIVASRIELINRGSIKAMHGTEFYGVAVDDPGNGGEPRFATGTRRLIMRLQDRICDSNC
jgi:hypothetical protein